ncbi:hypothetical protein QBC35DRAFT_532579 [Podospora australis]|uniref:Anaphase-promoting complex subunit 1 n=1 Tax=Podospora australis TaxID=1536484 RepID=A0AAN6WTD3_9PEZI|nr:hypothetical protein QBC35DRAFT_532579 [Podospora australis]
MASITSLGVQQPIGLRHAIEEGILPPNPPPSSYTWDNTTDTEVDHPCEDELLTTENCVLWSRGGVFRKSFKFDLENEPITQALLAYFPASADQHIDPETTKTKPISRSKTEPQSIGTATKQKSKPSLSRALVVFLKTQAHIYFLSGPSHVVHMPFEVESACAAPCGIIIQRKPRANNSVPISLRLPKVPPNSFVSSQPPSSAHTQRGPEFSVEGLGNPKVLPLRLSSTLENMWQPPIETSESHWPRLVCLTDPLLELGLVVAQPERAKTTRGRRSSVGPHFLSPAEEILHVQAIKPRTASGSEPEGLTVAVTVNRESGMYTVWRLTYLENEDPFVGKKKRKRNLSSSRRRSSMAPGLASGAATPIHPSTRESFGVPLPGKKTRKSVRIEEAEKALDNALNSLDPDKGADATRRQSRRVSSLLARADLSTSQDRTTFAESHIQPSHGSRRAESYGNQRNRLSSGFGAPSFSGSFNANNHLTSLHEGPVDNLLEELRAGGDFEGFLKMGLDDYGFEGLTHEMLFTKIHSFSMDLANVRYSLSSKPARTQAKVFIVVGPPTAADDHGRSLLLVGIQDPVDNRLQLLTLHIESKENNKTPTKSTSKTRASANPGGVVIAHGEPTRVQSVVDSCKLLDGEQQTIMILSEDNFGGRELSLQSPWGRVTILSLPLLFYDNLNSLDYNGSYITEKETGGRRSIGVGIPSTQIESIRHSNSRGVVDLVDKEGRHHRVRIQLQPRSLQVRRTLDACRSVLHSSQADKMIAGWWHIMQWLQDLDLGDLERPVTDTEWSATVILLLSTFLALGHHSEKSLQSLAGEVLKPSAPNDWDLMHSYEKPNSSACPTWARSKGWVWLLDSGILEQWPTEPEEKKPVRRSFLSVHVDLARRWMGTASGITALGFDGYLPTALGKGIAGRNMAAQSIVHALHLLLEEQKLNILSPEETSPGQTDLYAVLCQLARWLGWHQYEMMYSLGMQEDVDPALDLVHSLTNLIPEPPPPPCVLNWIQEHLTTGGGGDYPTLSTVYTNATQDTVSGHLRKPLWASLTTRSLMFKRFFEIVGTSTRRHAMVVALHDCGFTPRILETLPEAILAPLQDVIFICQPNPSPSWPRDLLSLISRTDVSAVLRPGTVLQPQSSEAPSHAARWDVRMLCQHLDGLHDRFEVTETERQAVVRSLWKEDKRLNQAIAVLSTSTQRQIRLDPKPEWTEAEYVEKQRELVATLATSTLAIPAGRGLMNFALRYPLLTQKYQIQGFQLTCLIRPVNNPVSVDKTLFTEEKINWAFFHQGVAGGLAISPHAKGIDTSWILYNKPGQDLNNRHAGFLLALGLNGHLKSVAKWVAFKYLTPKHTMTSIGLLLGLAASYLGTMDSLITRLMSVHVTRMLPRGAAELNLSKHTQTTGIMGIGLLYCNSQHRRMSEIMMSEIEHLEDGEEENPLRDEGYRLAAGFALGFINLGKGNDLRGLRDMSLTEKLLTIATSTKRVEIAHVLDRAAAGAVIAIALIFMKSEDHIVARKIDVPDTILQFDYVRPDILLLRTVAKNIILWSEIEPSFEWIGKGLPAEYRARHQLSSTKHLQSRDLSFFSILAGLCFALGLRFAGSANIKVRDLLVHYLDQFMRIVRSDVSSFDAKLAQGNARMCMDLLALSCATVMAGTGDIIVFRRLRSLHGRQDSNTTYGSHLAAHLAIGALFLGQGTVTFGTSNLATAALIVAFYPLFPANVQDNRSHLQAFRHFWVLATEPRCLVVKDLVTGQPISAPVLIHLKPGSPTAVAASDPTNLNVTMMRREAPCLLPPLDDILRVETDSSALGYWDLTIDFENQPHLLDDFRKNQSVYLRRRPAHDGTFSATLRALEDGGVSGGKDTATQHDPLEWVFDLDSFRDLTHAERALVLDRLGSGGGIGEGEGASTAVDTKLVLQSGLNSWSRDRLVGLKLLFEWAERRGAFVGPRAGLGAAPAGTGVPTKDEPVNQATAAANAKTSKTAKGKGKKQTESSSGGGGGGGGKKGKGKKVSMSVDQPVVAVIGENDAPVSVQAAVGTAAPKEGGGKEMDPVERGDVWWLRDSTIEELKGRVWLAGRGGVLEE